jgi:hypothetical protein
MILQPQAAAAIQGRVTDAERRAARGHAPLAICVPDGRSDLARSLERRLFGHGYVVHVIEKPEHLREAIRTTLAAGLIAVIVPNGVEDWDIIRATVPPELLVNAESVRQGMDEVARVGPLQGPLTGGAGI